MLKEEQQKKVIDLCQRLMKIPSLSGQEGGVAEALKAYFEANGFDEVIIDAYGSIIGTIRGSRPGKKLLFDGHIDTVPVINEEKWTYPPFGAQIEGGRIYGRGASDMKGAVAAMACAATYFSEASNRDFAGEIHVAGVVHEECFEGIAARSISRRIQPDYVVIGEASNLNLKIGQRGRGEILLETFGVPAHSANPEKGVNAVYGMSKVIQALREIEPVEHPVLGKGILELTDIKSAPYPGASVVPQYCRTTYDRRLLVGETKASVLAPIQAVLDRLMTEDPSLRAKASFARGEEACYSGGVIEGERFFPGWLYDRESDYIQACRAQLVEMGFNPEITQYNFCTNGSHYAGEAGIMTLGMGPSAENLAHTIDEYIEIEQLIGVTECYMGIMKALLKV